MSQQDGKFDLMKGEFQKAIDDYREALKKDELRQKITNRKLGVRKTENASKGVDLDTGVENMLKELQGDLIRYEDKEFAVKKVEPSSKLTKPVASGISLINQKYKKTLSHPELDESIEMEASKMADMLHDKGYSERQKGNLDQAIIYYSQALDLCPDHQTVGNIKAVFV